MTFAIRMTEVTPKRSPASRAPPTQITWDRTGGPHLDRRDGSTPRAGLPARSGHLAMTNKRRRMAIKRLADWSAN